MAPTRTLDRFFVPLLLSTQEEQAYWRRSWSDTETQMTDVRSAVEALTRAVASVVFAVERVSNETPGLLNRELDR